MVGRLIYLSHTRLDKSFAISLVSPFMHNPIEADMNAVRKILSYVKATRGKGILFILGADLKIQGYIDVDYGGSLVDRRSTTGYCVFLGRNLIYWRSKKQGVVTRSSVEAEFRVMALGVCELLWVKIILEDLKILAQKPIELLGDNQSAISIAAI